MDAVVAAYVRSMHLEKGLDERRVFKAWDEASAAAPYTLNRSFRGGTLYVTISSSVVRSNLFLQRNDLAAKINAILEKDSLYTGSGGPAPVKKIVLK